jgi:hypothetical protein
MENDFYAVLAVAPTAEDCVIRAAYKALCQQHHPDKAPEVNRGTATARLSAITEAYAVLGDPQKRKDYDARRPAPNQPACPPMPRPSLFNRVAILCARGLIVAGSVFMADVVAIEKKSWWRWAWDAVTSLGADTSHFVVHWPLWLLVVGLGVVVAWRVFRSNPSSTVARVTPSASVRFHWVRR